MSGSLKQFNHGTVTQKQLQLEPFGDTLDICTLTACASHSQGSSHSAIGSCCLWVSCHLAAVPVPWLCKSGANPQPLARGSSISRHPEPSLQLPLLPPCSRCVPQHPLKNPLEPLTMSPDFLVPGTPPVLAHVTVVSHWPPTTPLRTRAQKSVTISTSQATQGNSCIPHSAPAPAILRYLSWRELFLFRLSLRRNSVFHPHL